MSQEQIEEYLEAIFDIAGENGAAKTTEIAKHLNNAPASVTEVFQRMAQNGLVRYESYKGASLTAKGLRIVIKLKRKHRLLEAFLDKILHIDRNSVHDQACKMEHALSDETEIALCKLLKGPTECPHGSPTPPCTFDVGSCDECLSENTRSLKKRKKRIVSITVLKPGQKGKIAFIHGGKGAVQRLCDLGLTNGTAVSLVRSAPLKGPIEICVRGCNLVVGRDIAEKIFVQAEE
ncbi:MAG: metal-dependent transcriptional regulator [Thermoplasmata archaeon]